MKKLILPTVFLFVSITSTAQSPNPVCFPKNNLFIPVSSQTGISKAEFNRVLDKIEKIYSPIFTEHGGSLSISRAWDDGTINAKAWRIFGYWYIKMYGGLARHKEVTSDGFTIVACHELGHHVGGFPKSGWYSVEGESDYYATLKCVYKVWADEDSEAKIKTMNVDAIARENCTKSFNNTKDRAVCIRSAMASKGLVRMLAEFSPPTMPELSTPDLSRVKKTNGDHPQPQCRLDTYFQAALCDANPNIEIGDETSDIGVCPFDKLGGRPACWYVKPK